MIISPTCDGLHLFLIPLHLLVSAEDIIHLIIYVPPEEYESVNDDMATSGEDYRGKEAGQNHGFQAVIIADACVTLFALFHLHIMLICVQTRLTLTSSPSSKASSPRSLG